MGNKLSWCCPAPACCADCQLCSNLPCTAKIQHFYTGVLDWCRRARGVSSRLLDPCQPVLPDAAGLLMLPVLGKNVKADGAFAKPAHGRAHACWQAQLLRTSIAAFMLARALTSTGSDGVGPWQPCMASCGQTLVAWLALSSQWVV